MKVQITADDSHFVSYVVAVLNDQFSITTPDIVHASEADCKRYLRSHGFSLRLVKSLTFVKL